MPLRGEKAFGDRKQGQSPCSLAGSTGKKSQPQRLCPSSQGNHGHSHAEAMEANSILAGRGPSRVLRCGSWEWSVFKNPGAVSTPELGRKCPLHSGSRIIIKGK